MAAQSLPDVWLRGPVDGIDPYLDPCAQAFLQVAEELPRRLSELTVEQLWQRPGGAASIGFHTLHVCGATERLLTYARGEALSPAQVQAARAEAEARGLAAAELGARVEAAMTAALAQLRATPRASLLEARAVGKLALPSTVLGLLCHAAEHASRHVGQIATTAKLLQAT